MGLCQVASQRLMVIRQSASYGDLQSSPHSLLVRVVHLGWSTYHAKSGRGDKSTRTTLSTTQRAPHPDPARREKQIFRGTYSLTQRPASRPEAGPSSPRKSPGKVTSPRKSPGKPTSQITRHTSPRKSPGKVARLLNAPCLAHLSSRVWGSGFRVQGLRIRG